MQPYAELFGLRCGIQSSHILNFSEEVVRDQALFVGSLLAAELEPRLRTAAGASSWQVGVCVCVGACSGGLLGARKGASGEKGETTITIL